MKLLQLSCRVALRRFAQLLFQDLLHERFQRFQEAFCTSLQNGRITRKVLVWDRMANLLRFYWSSVALHNGRHNM
eukprot:3430530-Amphidinium_carterae.1